MKTKTLSPQKALDTTKRAQYVDKDVLETMPSGTGKEVTFFKLGKYASCMEVAAHYASRGLVPSPVDVCTFDVKHPEKMDEMEYVATQWGDGSGNWCFATFHRFHGERSVYVGRDDDDWHDHWWFAGVPAPGSVAASTSSSDTKSSSDTQNLVLPREEALKLIGEMEEIIGKLKKVI